MKVFKVNAPNGKLLPKHTVYVEAENPEAAKLIVAGVAGQTKDLILVASEIPALPHGEHLYGKDPAVLENKQAIANTDRVAQEEQDQEATERKSRVDESWEPRRESRTHNV
jgi:hypothetical protein